jgi:hypothetical protein
MRELLVRIADIENDTARRPARAEVLDDVLYEDVLAASRESEL